MITTMWLGIRRWLDHRIATVLAVGTLVAWALASWRVARALDTLLGQLNKLAPRRSKVSDGSIGDAAHAARTSDHNPWYHRIVTARDFTHDPRGGLDCHKLAAWLVASLDHRIKYIIWDRRIWQRNTGWQPYYGSNPHTHHLHLSVVASPACDDTRPWKLGTNAIVRKQVLKVGMRGDQVRRNQRLVWARLTPDRLARLRREHGDLHWGVYDRTFAAYVTVFGKQVGINNSGQIGGRTRKWLDMRTLRRGMSGEDVQWLQAVLQKRTGINLKVGGRFDGVFGKDTERAVRAYQKSEGMKVDGIVGNSTWNTVHRGVYAV